MGSSLNRMFSARSIAIIGASKDPSKRGYQAIQKLLYDGYDGQIYPINPKADEILGLRVYSSVLDVNSDIDLVLICTPASTLPKILAQCGTKHIPGAVVLAAGVSEGGLEGSTISEATLDAARSHNVRVIGPNTNGIFNLHNTMNLVGVQGVETGHIGVCSQSGNMLLSFITEAARRGGVGFSSYIGVGNQLDLSLTDYLNYLGNDKNTKTALFYIEGFQDGRTFLDACRTVTQKKPVVIYKSGRTEAGQVTASSHTGALASSFALTSGLLRQAGATVVEHSEKILSVAEGLSKLPLANGSNVAVLADGGGHATVTVDALIDIGVPLATLSDETVSKLKAILPPAASLVNPVDVAGGTDNNPGRCADCAEIILQDEGVDFLMIVGMYGGYADRFNNALLDNEIKTSHRLARLVERSRKPLLVQSVYSALRTQPIEALKAEGIPVFVWPEPAVRCVYEAIAYAKARKRIKAYPLVESMDADPIAKMIISTAISENRNALYEYEAKDLLKAYGIKIPAQFLAKSAGDISRVTSVLDKSPMAMKIVSQDILHKSDAGGVKLNVAGDNKLQTSYHEIINKARAYNIDADIHGVLVTPMVRSGVEVIIGVVHDRIFGPVMMFGLGGIFVEVLKDISFRALPMSEADAHEMIDEIRSRVILDGVRGEEAIDRDALVKLMVNVSQIALAHPQISEIDLNPVIVRSDGYDIVDARMLLNTTGATNV